ncbi:MAG: hypothetical protein H7259_02030 [Cytophagales bacterium]|nr:hypothetical protein [Cytophaga sp.]
MEKNIQNMIDQPIEFKLNYYFSKSWEIFGKAPGLFIGAILIEMLISAIGGMIPFIGPIVSFIFSTIFSAGFYIVSKKINANENVEFNDLFGGFELSVKLILITILSTVLISIGFLLLIPGIYLLVAYALAIPIALFSEEGIWDTMEASRKIVTKNWFRFLLFFLLLLLFNIAGAVLLLVGLLVTIPVSIISIYVIYDDMMKPLEDSMYFKDIETLDSDI